MSNKHPKTNGLSRGTPQVIGYIEQEITDCIHAWIKGEEYEPPAPGARLREPEPVILRKREVCRRTGLSYVTIWKRERAGRFPQRVRLK